MEPAFNRGILSAAGRVRGLVLGVVLGMGLVPGAVFPQGAEPVAGDEAGTAGTPADPHQTLDSFYTLYQPYVDSISPYQPVYFLGGVDLAESKFQISFKYRILNADGGFVRRYPWLSGLHFGYTQTSFWDLESSSLPFDDTSYKPELFHLTRNLRSGSRGLFFKSAVFHESNGKSQEDSRGINTAYIQSIMVFYHPGSRYGLSIAPKVWGYFSTSENNRDIADYRGYFDIDVKLGKADGLVASAVLGWAKEGGSLQADLTYPVGEWLFSNINLYLQLQYVNALAENLLDYQERTEAVRLGISFVR